MKSLIISSKNDSIHLRRADETLGTSQFLQ